MTRDTKNLLLQLCAALLQKTVANAMRWECDADMIAGELELDKSPGITVCFTQGKRATPRAEIIAGSGRAEIDLTIFDSPLAECFLRLANIALEQAKANEYAATEQRQRHEEKALADYLTANLAAISYK